MYTYLYIYIYIYYIYIYTTYIYITLVTFVSCTWDIRSPRDFGTHNHDGFPNPLPCAQGRAAIVNRTISRKLSIKGPCIFSSFIHRRQLQRCGLEHKTVRAPEKKTKGEKGKDWLMLPCFFVER